MCAFASCTGKKRRATSGQDAWHISTESWVSSARICAVECPSRSYQEYHLPRGTKLDTSTLVTSWTFRTLAIHFPVIPHGKGGMTPNGFTSATGNSVVAKHRPRVKLSSSLLMSLGPHPLPAASPCQVPATHSRASRYQPPAATATTL